MPATSITSADGTTLAARCSGRGSPIVLVHGADGDLDTFALIEGLLAERHSVWVYSRRGRATRYRRAQVKTAFADVLDSMPDANWGDGRHFVISDDYGVSEWRLTGTLLDGNRVDVFGCDLLTVRDNKIVRKNSFRKQRPLAAD